MSDTALVVFIIFGTIGAMTLFALIDGVKEWIVNRKIVDYTIAKSKEAQVEFMALLEEDDWDTDDNPSLNL